MRPWIAILISGLAGLVLAYGSTKMGTSPDASVVWLAVAWLACYVGLYVFGVVKSAPIEERSAIGRAILSVLDWLLGVFASILKYLAIAFTFVTTASCLLVSIGMWISICMAIGIFVAASFLPIWPNAPPAMERLAALAMLTLVLIVSVAVVRWFVKARPKKQPITGADGALQKPGWCPQCNVSFGRRGDELVCPRCNLSLPVADAGKN